MTQLLTLYYAPDNASLCVRLALLEMGIRFETVLVDRGTNAQRDPDYLALNPNGLIPVLITPSGPIYETAAILLWLADQDAGEMFAAPEDRNRGEALTWLFWLSNTLHPSLRVLFYPDYYIDDLADPLRDKTRQRVMRYLKQLNDHAKWLENSPRGILACYLAPMLRWLAIYGGETDWFELSAFPNLLAFAQTFENRSGAHQASIAEGLGETPFSDPILPNPPEGKAI